MEEKIATHHPTTDDFVATVVRNWFPRFIANGLDYLDVERTLGAVARRDDWVPAWVAAGERYERAARDALAAGHLLTAGAHLRRAALTFHFAQFVLTTDEPLRRAVHDRMTRAYVEAAPLLRPPAARVDIPWRGTSLRGYLRVARPDAALVVLVPGIDSTKEQFSTFEPFLLERGLSTLSFEGPGQGETWYEHGWRNTDYLDATRALFRWIAQWPETAGRPVALLGTSFGGYLALRAAAEVPVAAVVDIAGFFDLSGLDGLDAVVRDNLARFMKVSPSELAGATTDVDLAPTLPLDVPVLVVHGEADPIVPVENARRIAAAQADAEVWLYPEGNHSCNNLHTIVRPAIADWLADRVGPRP